jgi:hypothetical protein
MTTRKMTIIPYEGPLGRLHVKDVDRLKHHKHDIPDPSDMRIPEPLRGSDMEKYNEMTSLLKSKKMTLGRDATKDRMKEMRALERKQRMNKAKCRCSTKKSSVKRKITKRR